ncbi:cofactor-independent phosphoglycerate mutase [Bacteroidales bacterium]|nr:cofactor-independent phosphoglycerate mutase [Bacteroidales bacterium]
MKYIIILGDGMADEPIAALGNKTPLQVASTPNIDKLAQMGASGMLQTVPEGFHPGSEIANLSVLGYNIAEVFEGRGSLEAASMGIDILTNEMAMRCNLICIENEKIKNHSAGHISTQEAKVLIDYLNQELSCDDISLFSGVSYRHLLKLKNGNKDLDTTPPHDAVGTLFRDVLIKSKTKDAEHTTEILNKLIIRSQELLKNHPVNLERIKRGKDSANSIWPWSPGYKPQMKKLSDIYPIKSGAVISAVDLINGIGVYAGLEPIAVEGATGLYDTNYEGKTQAALKALKDKDFVYLHIEASDEAGHEGDIDLKIKTIEYLDQRVVKPILEELKNWDQEVCIALLPDHPTPCSIKTHTSKPVPFIIYKPHNKKRDEVCVYDEFAAERGKYGLLKGDEFMKMLMNDE